MSLNERIAWGKGLDCIEIHNGKVRYCSYHHCTLNHADEYKYIDYTKDPERILELVLELLNTERWYPIKEKEKYTWNLFTDDPGINYIEHEDFGIATAMAYCEEKGL